MSVTIDRLCPLLQVFEMPRALAFYRDQLRFEVIQRDRDTDDCDWVWLRWGSAELMLNTEYEAEDRPAAADPHRISAHADTTLYLHTPDVDTLYTEWCQRHGDCDPPVIREYGMKQWTLTDPDGYQICFQCPAAAK